MIDVFFFLVSMITVNSYLNSTRNNKFIKSMNKRMTSKYTWVSIL